MASARLSPRGTNWITRWRDCAARSSSTRVNARTAGHVVVGGTDGAQATLVPLRLGVKPVGILATGSSPLDIGTLDALGGVIAIAIERAHFLAERKKVGDAESARRSRVRAPRVVQS